MLRFRAEGGCPRLSLVEGGSIKAAARALMSARRISSGMVLVAPGMSPAISRGALRARPAPAGPAFARVTR